MFGFKKKKAEVPETPHVCNHKFLDFPWYIVVGANTSGNFPFKLRVVAPYVCVKCKERRNEILYETVHNHYSVALAERDSLIKRFGEKIQHQVLVEDMVKDMQLVDREYIELVDKVVNEKNYCNNFGTDLFKERTTNIPVEPVYAKPSLRNKSLNELEEEWLKLQTALEKTNYGLQVGTR